VRRDGTSAAAIHRRGDVRAWMVSPSSGGQVATSRAVSSSCRRRVVDWPSRQRQLAENHDRGVTFGRPGGCGDCRVDDEAMAILGEQMPEIRQPGFVPAAFLVEARIGSVVD